MNGYSNEYSNNVIPTWWDVGVATAEEQVQKAETENYVSHTHLEKEQ